jgi:hypothetical protein
MPKLVLPLTEAKLKNAKPLEKTYKLSDGGGLYLEVTPVGSKLWRLGYTQQNGKKNRLALGAYPVVTLAAAREKRLKVKQQIDAGIDPAQARRAAKQHRSITAANTFEVIAREWHANKEGSWKESTSRNVLQRLEHGIFPGLGKYPITEIKAPQMLDALRQIEKRGALEMARRCAQFSGQVFRYAIATAARRSILCRAFVEPSRRAPRATMPPSHRTNCPSSCKCCRSTSSRCSCRPGSCCA